MTIYYHGDTMTTIDFQVSRFHRFHCHGVVYLPWSWGVWVENGLPTPAKTVLFDEQTNPYLLGASSLVPQNFRKKSPRSPQLRLADQAASQFAGAMGKPFFRCNRWCKIILAMQPESLSKAVVDGRSTIMASGSNSISEISSDFNHSSEFQRFLNSLNLWYKSKYQSFSWCPGCF